MNAGYISIWIMLMVYILMTTGWSDFVGLAVNRKKWVLIAMAVCAVLQPIQETFRLGSIQIHVFAGTILLMLISLLAMRGPLVWDSRGYLLICALLAGMIWGSVRKMYSVDPVFFWLDPLLDGPVVAGLLAAAFSSKGQHQLTVLLYAGAAAELVHALLQRGVYEASVGSLQWWDSIWIAFVAARLISLLFLVVRTGLARFIAIPWRNKGGSSPE
ncbi:YphA family membrane protein [Paenibacillus sp. MMO-177]|uniref:YphA family membrane protein n=1 Tax=Paenibacillus sp. MMO-177 TaxID=3081289 RepID=UPI003015BDF6